MSDLQEQLVLLRQRIAKIDRKHAGPRPPAPPPPPIEEEGRFFPEEWVPGQEAATPHGCHYEMHRLYERHRRHGSMDISSLSDLPPHVLGPISNGEIAEVPPEKWCFLDTETTGLSGGTGTYAFLIGVGRITPEGFRVRQFFMRDYGEEPSQLHALAEHLREFDVVVTYNGKTFDLPLLETRYRMCRARTPFSNMAHLDLLFGARRLWKLRFDSCRLMELENQILGVERQGDLPGEMIPYVYFEYVRTREAFRLAPVFHHNAIDILTLACMTAIVPWAFHPPGNIQIAHAAEMVGLARWWRQAGNLDNALALFREALQRGLPDALLFRTLWDTACLEKKMGGASAAVARFVELTETRNPFRAAALEELAKFYEHGERNFAIALEMTRTALSVQTSETLLRRQERLERRLARVRSARLL